MQTVEEEIINKVLKSDTASFSYFVDIYEDMAYTIAFRIVKNRQEAEDVVQMAFVSMYKNLNSFRFSSKLSTWFYRIVVNIALNQIKSCGFSNQYEDYKVLSESEESIHNNYLDALQILERSERTKIVQELLDKMPTDQSLVLILFYMEDNTIKDVALAMGISENNVKVKLHRARKYFCELIESYKLKELFWYEK